MMIIVCAIHVVICGNRCASLKTVVVGMVVDDEDADDDHRTIGFFFPKTIL